MESFPESSKPIDLDIGAGLSVDASSIPDNLHVLIPLVNKWSFDSLSDQDVFVASIQRERPNDVETLTQAFNESARQQVQEWAESLPFDKHKTEFSDEDREHPYWKFLNVFKLLESISGTNETAITRHRAEIRDYRFREAATEADDAFRSGNYAIFVELLSEFEDLLTETQAKKLLIARRRSTP